MNRRRALSLFGTAGIAAIMRSHLQAAGDTCVATSPAMTEGPYWIEEKLFRSDTATGIARPGIPLNLTIKAQNAAAGGCAPLPGALIDIWHCDAGGLYSDETAFNPGGGTGTVSTAGQKFLCGYQVTDDAGQVKFLTIRVRTYSGATVLDNYTTQLFFDDAISNAVLSRSPYTRSASRDTTNARDGIDGGAPTRRYRRQDQRQ